VEFFRALAAAYLIATLSATALAKLKSWRVSSVSVLREGVIPPRAATAVTVAVAAVEFLLATLFMLGTDPAVTGFAATGLFLAFCGYQLLVAARTNSLICTCAGTTRSDPASPPAVAGTVLACLLQAALACTLALVGGRPGGTLGLLTITAWAAPIIVFLVGLLRQSGRPEIDKRFPVEFASHRYDFEEISGGHMVS
jgi:hypothetical protein